MAHSSSSSSGARLASQVHNEECEDLDQSTTVTIGDDEPEEQMEAMETMDESDTAGSEEDGALQDQVLAKKMNRMT